MKWSEDTWKVTLPVYNQIIQLPFVDGLINGTLDISKFEFYIQQDALYLAEYGKVLSGIAARLIKSDHISSFLYFAKDTMDVEQALHQSFIDKNKQKQSLQASPTCLLYTSYLHRILANNTIEVALAGVLPCFWIYREVGNYILKNQTKGENPYQKWIDTYGGNEYSQAVDKAISICDELADEATPKQRQQMTQAFEMCSKMEWMFWDSAWNLESWKI